MSPTTKKGIVNATKHQIGEESNSSLAKDDIDGRHSKESQFRECIRELSSVPKRSSRIRRANPKYSLGTKEEQTRKTQNGQTTVTESQKNQSSSPTTHERPKIEVGLKEGLTRTRKQYKSGTSNANQHSGPSLAPTLLTSSSQKASTPKKRRGTKTKTNETHVQEQQSDNRALKGDNDDDLLVITELSTPPKRSCRSSRPTSSPSETTLSQITLVEPGNKEALQQRALVMGDSNTTTEESANNSNEGNCNLKSKGKETMVQSTIYQREKQEDLEDDVLIKEDSGDEFAVNLCSKFRRRRLQILEDDEREEMKQFQEDVGKKSVEMAKTSIKDAHPHLIDPIFEGRITGKWCDYLFGPQFRKKMMLTIIDSENNEIQAVVEDIDLDKWNEELQLGAVYQISNSLIVDSRQRNKLTPHLFNMNILSTTMFEKIHDDSTIPLQRFYIKQLNEINVAFASPEILIDVLGVIAKCEPCRLISTINGMTNISGLYLADESNTVIKITLWGEFATNYSERLVEASDKRQIIMVTKLKVGNYKGVYNLKTTHFTQFFFEPANVLPDARVNVDITKVQRNMDQRLHYTKQCKTDDQVTIAELISRSTSAIQERTLFVITAKISTFRLSEGICYPACHSCFSQYQTIAGTTVCNKCKIKIAEEIKRPRLKIQVEDDTGKVDVTLFGIDAELAMGVPLNKLMPNGEKPGNMSDLDEIFNVRLNKKFIFNITVTPKNSYFASKRSFTATSIIEA